MMVRALTYFWVKCSSRTLRAMLANSGDRIPPYKSSPRPTRRDTTGRIGTAHHDTNVRGYRLAGPADGRTRPEHAYTAPVLADPTRTHTPQNDTAITITATAQNGSSTTHTFLAQRRQQNDEALNRPPNPRGWGTLSSHGAGLDDYLSADPPAPLQGYIG